MRRRIALRTGELARRILACLYQIASISPEIAEVIGWHRKAA
jgi:hypothetical protein